MLKENISNEAGGSGLILFLLFSIPLTYLIVNSLFNNQNIKKRIVIMPFASGMIISIPILVLYWAFFDSFFNNWTSAGLYFYHFFNRDGLVGIYAVIIFSLYYFFLAKDIKESMLREITGYLSGLYFIIAIYDSLVVENWYGNLELFLVPMARISAILLISLFFSRTLKCIDWKKYLWIGLAVIIPVLISFIPVMYVSNLKTISVVFTIIFFCSTVIVYYLEIKGRLKNF